jgi:geranylgeranyl reductase family protein
MNLRILRILITNTVTDILHLKLLMWDVIVVGCGPAGAIAAYELARNSLRVLMLEKAKIPRYKTCGGGLVQRTVDAIPFSIENVIEREIHTIRLSNDCKNPVVIQRDQPVVRMTMRADLDSYLTEKAAQQGAELQDHQCVREVSETSDHVICKTDSDLHKARFLIAADGANSIVARSLGIPEARFGVALEVEVNLGDAFKSHAEMMDLDFNVLPQGYGWVFPKASHLSCGVFTMRRNSHEIRKFYDRYIRRKAFSGEIQESSLTGHLVPLGPRSDKLNTSRIMLVGDAAGLADPLTGEGISFAIRTGMMAARTVIHSPDHLDRYSVVLQETVLPEIRISRLAARALYAAPSFFYNRVVSRPFFAESILNLFSGKKTYRQLAKHALLNSYKLL